MPRNRRRRNRNPDEERWSTREIRAIVQSVPTVEHSLERRSFIKPEAVAECAFLVDGKKVNYRTRFQLEMNLSQLTKDSVHDLQPGTYLKLDEYRFSPRAGRDESQHECVVRKFKISNPQWTWTNHLSQIDRDMEFLRNGIDLSEIL